MEKQPPHPEGSTTTSTTDILPTEPTPQDELQPPVFTDCLLQQQHLVATATSLVRAVAYLGLDEPGTWQGWEWEAGTELLGNPDLCIRAHALTLMLNDLNHQPELCVMLIEQLRDALQHTTQGPLPPRDKDVIPAPSRTLYRPTLSA